MPTKTLSEVQDLLRRADRTIRRFKARDAKQPPKLPADHPFQIGQSVRILTEAEIQSAPVPIAGTPGTVVRGEYDRDFYIWVEFRKPFKCTEGSTWRRLPDFPDRDTITIGLYPHELELLTAASPPWTPTVPLRQKRFRPILVSELQTIATAKDLEWYANDDHVHDIKFWGPIDGTARRNGGAWEWHHNLEVRIEGDHVIGFGRLDLCCGYWLEEEYTTVQDRVLKDRLHPTKAMELLVNGITPAMAVHANYLCPTVQPQKNQQ